MSKFGTFLKVSVLAGALALTSQALAASTFKVPINYTVKVFDGKTSDFGYSRSDRTITMQPGRHQIVLLFEGSFGNARDSRLIQAANPIVVEIPNIPDNQNYTFDYDMPSSELEAEQFARAQKINLINADTKAPLSAEQADYYILTSDSGFAILRDYREDLASIGRLYAPAPVLAEMQQQNQNGVVNNNGVRTIQARSGGSFIGGAAAGTAVAANGMSATVNNAAQEMNAAQNSTGPKKVQSLSSGGATYNQLVNLYDQADDATKLQFVKYIMSH